MRRDQHLNRVGSSLAVDRFHSLSTSHFRQRRVKACFRFFEGDHFRQIALVEDGEQPKREERAVRRLRRRDVPPKALVLESYAESARPRGHRDNVLEIRQERLHLTNYLGEGVFALTQGRLPRPGVPPHCSQFAVVGHFQSKVGIVDLLRGGNSHSEITGRLPPPRIGRFRWRLAQYRYIAKTQVWSCLLLQTCRTRRRSLAANDARRWSDQGD